MLAHALRRFAALKSAAVVEKMAGVLETKGPDLIKQVNAVFHFEVREKEGDEPTYYSIDLKNAPGFAKEGKHGDSDATFIILDEDLVAIANKTLNP